MQAITILDTSIRQDAEGRHSLNDLHRAAMAAAGREGNPNDDQHRPALFLRSAGVQALAKKHGAVGLIRGKGRPQGTYATMDIAMKYAEWLFSGYTIIRQFPVFGGKCRIVWYIPELRLAVEFDEAHHTTPANAAADAARQAEIESALNCRFLRYKAD